MALYHDDCRLFLPKCSDKSVDMVLADPPEGCGQGVLDECLRIARRWVVMMGPLRWHGDTIQRPDEDFDPKPDWTTTWWVRAPWLSLGGEGVLHVWGPKVDAHFLTYWVEQDEHPGAKPVRIFADILAAFAPTSVLDPFAGTGPVAVAAEAAGIPWTLVEVEPAYCAMIRRRLGLPNPERSGSPCCSKA